MTTATDTFAARPRRRDDVAARRSHRASPGTSPRAFTLIELLVVMGVLLLLAVVTTMASARIGKDVKLKSAVNTVTAALGEARAAAIRSGNLVLVTFRISPQTDDAARGQVSEVVVSEWTRRTEKSADGETLIDVFRPIQNIPPRALPKGVKVAGPWTDQGSETLWINQPQFDKKGTVSEADRCFSILFGPDGALLTRNPVGAMSVDHVAFVDYDVDNQQDIGNANAQFANWIYDELGDECWLNPVMALAVYDDDDARDRNNTAQWGVDDVLRRKNLSDYITQYADRINFNHYTGTVTPQEAAR